MSKFAQGQYNVQNPEKYVGKGIPRYRSSWELDFMRQCDGDPRILQWASESIIIKYKHPFTGKTTNYVPDFFIIYNDIKGNKQAELIEIKPRKQSMIEGRMREKDKQVVAINHAKWEQAARFCAQYGMTFRVLNEQDLFRNGPRK